MGVACSILSVFNLCINRMLKWFSCVCMLGGLMMCMAIVIAYGIAIGYQTAQKDLARFANAARGVNLTYSLHYDSYLYSIGPRRFNLLRNASSLLNNTDVTVPMSNILDFYDKSPPNTTFSDSKGIPVLIEFTTSTLSTVSEYVETTTLEDFTETELSEKVVERARRSKDNISVTSNQKFWRPLKTKRKQT